MLKQLAKLNDSEKTTKQVTLYFKVLGSLLFENYVLNQKAKTERFTQIGYSIKERKIFNF